LRIIVVSAGVPIVARLGVRSPSLPLCRLSRGWSGVLTLVRTGPGFDEQSVLALVNQLHAANPAKMTFTLAEVAEALYGPGSAAFARGSVVMTSAGQPVERHIMPAWMEVLNNILKKLGEEGRLQVMTTAVVVFPPGVAEGRFGGDSIHGPEVSQ
jgi:hypothetical protein